MDVATSGTSGGPPSIAAWEAVARPARPVVRELLLRGPRTRTELARLLGLSTGSLTRLTKPLVQAGLVVERGTVHDPVNGRPTRPLDVVARDHHFLGVKLTADRVYAVVTDLRAEVVAEGSEPLRSATPEGAAAQARDLARRLAEASAPPVAAGFTLGGNRAARPGLFDAPHLGWRGVPLQDLLRDVVGLPCVVRNDVFALAHAQAWFGAARGLTAFALLTVGAGIGYALCLHGRVVEIGEEDVIAFGHHVLDPGGPMCPVGHRGCVSAYLSSHAIQAAAAHGLRRELSLTEVARRAADGDPVCRSIAREAGWALGATVAAIVNVTGVKTVVVGGESVDVVRAVRPDVERGIGERRLGDPGALSLPMLSASFTEWARGGAVEAIRTFVAEGR